MEFQRRFQRSPDLACRANCHCGVAQSTRGSSNVAGSARTAICYFVTCLDSVPRECSLPIALSRSAGNRT